MVCCLPTEVIRRLGSWFVVIKKDVLLPFVIILLTFFLPQFAFSQDVDSLPKPTAKTINFAYDMDETRVDYPLDTGLSQFHYYDPVDRMDFLYRNTGALGSAAFRLVCCEEQRMGLRMGYEQFNLYRYSEDNVPFYRNVRPYSQLNFLIGLKKEQTINVEHSQNIGKKLNFGFHYLRFATSGTFVNQRTRHNDLAFTTTFDSKKLYRLKTMLTFNNIRGEENGGVTETSIYSDTSFVSKELVRVELEGAENKQREISFRIRQSFRGGYVSALPDSWADSTGTQLLLLPVKPSWEVYHEIEVGREGYEYTDDMPDSAYYAAFYPNDSNAVGTLKSEAQKVFIGTKAGFRQTIKDAFVLDASSSYTLNLVEQDSFSKKQIHYWDATLSLGSDTGSLIAYGASATYSFVDYNKSDFKSHAFVGYTFSDAANVQLSAGYSRIEPTLIFQRFAFGNISWENDFDKQSMLTAELRYRLPKYRLQAAVRFNQISHFTFWHENRLPAQYNGSLQTMVIELRKLFRINYFGFDNVLYVQLVSDKNLLRYPVYWGVHSFYYERGAFKGKLLTRVGFDIRYNTNYKAPGYFPLTGQFYLQNEEQLSFYPALDFYVCFKIKTARLFVKMQHLNQGMFKDKGYFNAYKYPATDRTFRFGLSWMFLD